MFLFHISLKSISLQTLKLHTGEVINPNSIKSSLSAEEGWNYIFFPQFQSRLQALSNQMAEIPLSMNTMITSTWHKSYLTKSQISILRNTFSAKLISMTPSRKLSPSCFSSSGVIFETTSTFSPSSYPSLKFTKLTDRMYYIRLPESIRSQTLHTLSNDPLIGEIRSFSGLSLKNRYNVGIIQQGYSLPQLINDVFQTQRAPWSTDPIDGINGTGVIITETDSGLSANSTYFYDSEHPFLLNTYNPSHRKIVYYGTISGDDKDDYPIGHGTHVGGIIAGEANCPDILHENLSSPVCFKSLYNGVAPGAKLAFFDASYTNDTVEDSGLLIPPLDRLKSIMKLTGSHISTNSWGGSGAFDGAFYTAIDNLAFLNPEMAFLFAAGNDGDEPFTIDSPAVSKNVISVGNLRTPFVYSYEYINSLANRVKLYPKYSFLSGSVSRINLGSDPIRRLNPTINYSKIIQYSNSLQCQDENGSLVVFSEGQSLAAFSSVSKSCAAAYLIISSKGKINIPSGSSNMGPPCFMISPELSESISYGESQGKLEPLLQNTYPLQMEKSSSRGPTESGIMKPEVSAPGMVIVSAESKTREILNYDGLTIMGGTSMATPAVAGAAALIEQYFSSGKYPGGSVNITGNLLRAALVCSAEPLVALTPGPRTVKDYQPNTKAGYGIVKLSNVISVKNSEIGVRIGNGNSTLGSDQSAKIKVGTPNGHPLRIAMAYLDQPISPGADISIIIDLSLYVVSPSGKVYYGGNYEGGTEEHFSTVERVVVPAEEVEEGEYSIHVISQNIEGYEIKYTTGYTIVASYPRGEFDENPDFLQFVDGSAELDCGKGKLINGRCRCPSNRVGYNCQGEIYNINTLEKEIDPHGIFYGKIKVPIYSRPEDEPLLLVESDFPFGYYFDIKARSNPGDYAISFGNLNGSTPITLGELAGISLSIAAHSLSDESQKIHLKLMTVADYISMETPTPSEEQTTTTSDGGTDEQTTMTVEPNSTNKLLKITAIIGFSIGLLLGLVLIIIRFKNKNGDQATWNPINDDDDENAEVIMNPDSEL